MIKSSVRILAVLLAAAVIGAGYGHFRGVSFVPDVQQIEKKREVRVSWKEQTAISLEDFVRHYQTGGLVIDARAAEAFEEGHLKAPIILNIPAAEADQRLEQALPFLGTPIVIYCSSDDCEDAESLWNTMKTWGFVMDTVKVFHPGWAGIEEAKLPTARGPDGSTDYLASQAGSGPQGAGVAQSPDDPAGGTEGDEADPDSPEPDDGDNP